MDTEMSAIGGQIHETQGQAVQLESKVQDCRQKITTLDHDSKKCRDDASWHRQESVRLRQEIGILQREDETHCTEHKRLDSVADKYIQEISVLNSERHRIEQQSHQVVETEAQLKDRRDKIKDRQVIAKKKLEELSSSSI